MGHKETIYEGILSGDMKAVQEAATAGLEEKIPAGDILNEAMIPAMDVVGDLFQKGEVYLPDMLMAAKAMKAGLEILTPRMVQAEASSAGTAVVGTVRGDMHDIGKNLLSIALEGAGFKVVDLGIDVTPEAFVESLKEHQPEVLGLSALLTTTMIAMREVIEAVLEAGLRDTVKVMIGGAPVTREYAEEIGADFYGPDSTSGKDFARKAVAEG